MKCPLLHHKERNPDIFPCEVFEDCFEEECSWWDLAHECCAVIALNQTFVAIGNVLGMTADYTSIKVKLARQRRQV